VSLPLRVYRPRAHRPWDNQQGAALIVALLVVMIVAMLVTAVASDALVVFRKVENQLHSQQAYAYLLTAEGVARKVLLDDLEQDLKGGKLDTRNELWAAEDLQFVTEQGIIAGQLQDLAGRLNLSSLSFKPTKTKRYSVDQQRFIRLLQVLEIEEPLSLNQAEQLANAVFDWLDDDDKERSPNGAESYYYASAEPPGRPANRNAVSVSELRWVKGVTPEIYQALSPHLTALPGSMTGININTASLAVIRSLNEDNELQPLLVQDAEKILEQIESDEGFENLSFFKGPSLSTKKIDTSGLVFRSEYFLLQAKTEFLSRSFSLQSIIHRDAAQKRARVIARSQATL